MVYLLRTSVYFLSLQRRPFDLPFPLDTLEGPWMRITSALLSFSVPPANFPTDGPVTPRSLRLLLFFGLTVGFSSIIPFSRASWRRFCSFLAALAMMPLRCDMGIFSCVYNDVFAPRDCIRRSIALCRFLPVGFRSSADSRRCDSLSNRCKARSFLRSSASIASSSSWSFLVDVDFVVEDSERDGGFAF